ncbi:MAG TPA: 4-(cytidine 5'-diphospho)-2-C-methyl-D-erythritol kinase [Prolixibacteraceae bacterium]|nr:4-(cytidine 5'-diphospho)-2-C-methyl-D-erythritol kinase [Prolixibacteraceae bacterium]
MISFPNAKINLGLHITEKRPDGFHNLETVFFPVGWSDVLEFAEADEFRFTSSGIRISCDPESNLVMKAYRLLQKDFRLPTLKIHLHKQIPFGAGLGGGSSDGAFMLRMLNKTYDLNISEEKLLDYAAQLGSDCPFFILNKPVFATGRGEIMQETDIRLNGMFIWLIKPPVEVSTANAFQFIEPKKTDFSLTEVLSRPVQEWKNSVVNQFESCVVQQFPVIAEIKHQLYDLGAVYASMSGSGSCVFGLFNELPLNWKSHFPIVYLTYSQKLQIL